DGPSSLVRVGPRPSLAARARARLLDPGAHSRHAGRRAAPGPRDARADGGGTRSRRGGGASRRHARARRAGHPRSGESLGGQWDGRDHLLEDGRIDGLHEVVVEARVEGALAVLVLPPAGERDDERSRRTVLLPNALARLVAV